jgi:hypothetical protein
MSCLNFYKLLTVFTNFLKNAIRYIVIIHKWKILEMDESAIKNESDKQS